jgi:hypothetical protein
VTSNPLTHHIYTDSRLISQHNEFPFTSMQGTTYLSRVEDVYYKEA